MNFKLLSVAALSVLVWLAAAMACGNDGDDNMGTPTTVPQESTPSASESEGPTVGQAPSIVFPQHDAPLETDRGGRYFAGRIVISKGCLRAEAPTRIASNPLESWLLIWPGAFTLEAESESVRIIDGFGRVRCKRGGLRSTQPRRRELSAGHGAGVDRGHVRGLRRALSPGG